MATDPPETSTAAAATPVINSTSLNPILNPLSPLALHQNDNPTVAIVLDQFVGSNFISWSHAIKRGLSVKNKLTLIDSSLLQPKEEEDIVIFAAWIRAIDLVLMWILNSSHVDIKKSLQYFTSAKALWEELNARYAKADGTRFVGSNFILWSHAIKRGLSVKNKLALIDSSLPQPKEEEDIVIFATWIRAIDLVLMWILNSIHVDIKKSLQYFTSAKALWEELNARYAKADGTRVYHLEKSLSSIKKGNLSLTAYYNSFKAFWDDFIIYRPLMSCKCGACTCDLAALVSMVQEGDCVMKFLVGLDDSYSTVRNQLLMQSPMPTLSKAFSILLQEESQRALHAPSSSNVEDQGDAIAMLAKNAKFYKDKKVKMTCSHCGGPGHTIDRCFQIIGYPPGWKGPRGPRTKSESTNANITVKSPTESAGEVSNPLFTQKMFEQFLKFTKNKKEGGDNNNSHSAAPIIVQQEHPVSKESGFNNSESDWFS